MSMTHLAPSIWSVCPGGRMGLDDFERGEIPEGEGKCNENYWSRLTLLFTLMTNERIEMGIALVMRMRIEISLGQCRYRYFTESVPRDTVIL